MDLEKAKTIHFLGIGGCGMSAIAKILHEMGKTVQGSDLKESSNTIRLKDVGIKVFIGHDEPNIRGADIIVYSSAIPKDNVEFAAAKASRIKLLARADALSYILDQFPTRISVAGTHGKTTTTSMISTMLQRGGLNPTYVIGAEADTVDGNAKLGNSHFAVAEADESDGSFLKLHPTISVITNIEADHMDYYKTMDKLVDTFTLYALSVPKDGVLIVNSDQENNRHLIDKLSGERRFILCGFNDKALIRAAKVVFNPWTTTFEVTHKGEVLGDISLSVPGMQNVGNALLAVAVGLEVGLPFSSIRDGLGYFAGVKRRFQLIGNFAGITVIDDYAHHPTEILATLSAARLNFPDKRIICVFQPHRYTRTMYLHHEFGKAFKDADIAVIAGIYSAGEDPIEGVSAKLIYDSAKRHSDKEVHYIPRKEKIVEFLLKNARENDMIITAGAGDIHTVGKEFLTRSREKPSNG